MLSRLDMLIILGCLAFGYWIVNKMLGGAGRARPDEKPDQGPFRPQPAEPAPALPPAPTSIEGVTLSNWFRILGVSESAKEAEIESAYRHLITQYHPDKVANLGAEIRAVADEKSKQLNAAYDIGMRLFR